VPRPRAAGATDRPTPGRRPRTRRQRAPATTGRRESGAGRRPKHSQPPSGRRSRPGPDAAGIGTCPRPPGAAPTIRRTAVEPASDVVAGSPCRPNATHRTGRRSPRRSAGHLLLDFPRPSKTPGSTRSLPRGYPDGDAALGFPRGPGRTCSARRRSRRSPIAESGPPAFPAGGPPDLRSRGAPVEASGRPPVVAARGTASSARTASDGPATVSRVGSSARKPSRLERSAERPASRSTRSCTACWTACTTRGRSVSSRIARMPSTRRSSPPRRAGRSVGRRPAVSADSASSRRMQKVATPAPCPAAPCPAVRPIASSRTSSATPGPKAAAPPSLRTSPWAAVSRDWPIDPRRRASPTRATSSTASARCRRIGRRRGLPVPRSDGSGRPASSACRRPGRSAASSTDIAREPAAASSATVPSPGRPGTPAFRCSASSLSRAGPCRSARPAQAALQGSSSSDRGPVPSGGRAMRPSRRLAKFGARPIAPPPAAPVPPAIVRAPATPAVRTARSAASSHPRGSEAVGRRASRAADRSPARSSSDPSVLAAPCSMRAEPAWVPRPAAPSHPWEWR